MRTGLGYDIHRLIPTVDSSTIMIGGFTIPCCFKVDSHSDGDVLLHALCDGMLGALALGDIGRWFPDNKQENKGRASSEFVTSVNEELKRLGWAVYQVDSTVHLEAPKLAPHIDKMRENIASMLSLELSDVSVKAKTGEGIGAIGTRKAIAAQVIVTIREVK